MSDLLRHTRHGFGALLGLAPEGWRDRVASERFGPDRRGKRLRPARMIGVHPERNLEIAARRCGDVDVPLPREVALLASDEPVLAHGEAPLPRAVDLHVVEREL